MHTISNGRCPGHGKPAPCWKPMPELLRSRYPFLMGFKSILAFRVGPPGWTIRAHAAGIRPSEGWTICGPARA